MTQTTEPTTAPATRPRQFYLDNLRVALTALVVIHHAAATYGGIPGAWYYTEDVSDPSATFLFGFLMVNQSFFMGAFFLISALFVPASFERKGGRRFLKDRLIRLGIPLLIFLVALRPLATSGIFVGLRSEYGAELPYWLFYLVSWDPGPMWFVELLLIFSLLYVIWRHLRSDRGAETADVTSDSGRPLSGTMIIFFGAGLAVATYLWRIVVPIGTGVPVLGLPTVAYLPQYASLFIIGLIAARRGWLHSLSVTIGRIGFAVAAVGAAGLLITLNSTGETWVGLGSWQSSLMAACESALAIGVIVGLLVLFRRRANHQGARLRFLSEHAYTVYVTHALVLVAVGYGLSGLSAPAAVKFGLLAVLAVPLCWAVALLVRALPGAKKVL